MLTCVREKQEQRAREREEEKRENKVPLNAP